MKTILALFFALSLVITPLAVAGGLGSADSDFMFGDVQEASAVTMSAEEMEGTAAKLLIIYFLIKDSINIKNNTFNNILNNVNIKCDSTSICKTSS